MTVPLPEDRGLKGDSRPLVGRFRSPRFALGQQLRAFRAERGLTQAEIARVVGATDHTTVSQWESGVTVPDGMRRERLRALLAGQLWPELRAVLLAGEGMTERWPQAVRWYRRASRERQARQTVGRAVATLLDQPRAIGSVDGLRPGCGPGRAGGDQTGAPATLDRQRAGVCRQGAGYLGARQRRSARLLTTGQTDR